MIEMCGGGSSDSTLNPASKQSCKILSVMMRRFAKRLRLTTDATERTCEDERITVRSQDEILLALVGSSAERESLTVLALR